MERLDWKVSAFLRKQNRTLEEDIGDFFKNLFSDLKKLAHYRVIKLSSSEYYIKDKLILNTIANAENFLNDFNDYMQHHAGVWEELLQKYKAPKCLENEQNWILTIASFQKDLQVHLEDLSDRAKGLQNNLQFMTNERENPRL